MCFVEQISQASGQNDRESKIDKKQNQKRSDKSKKLVVAQGLDEDDDHDLDVNNDEEEPGIAARDMDRELHAGSQMANINNLARQISQSNVREATGPPNAAPFMSQNPRTAQRSEINLKTEHDHSPNQGG